MPETPLPSDAQSAATIFDRAGDRCLAQDNNGNTPPAKLADLAAAHRTLLERAGAVFPL